MPRDAFRLDDAFASFDERWSPRIVARINDLDLKVVKVEGEFAWHTHTDTDELFLVHRGSVVIELRDRRVELGPGDGFVVPRGVDHRPVAGEVCELLLLEPVGTVNTGEAGGELTAAEDRWI